MATLKTVADVRHEREMLEYQVDAFLRGKGWNHTSHTPGCYWMWEREVDGRRILAEKDMALSIQAALDADADNGEDDAPDSCRDEPKGEED